MLCAITGTQVLNRKGFWQTEGIPVDGQKPFFLHFAQLIGQGAAVYFQIIGQLLAVEWNGDFQASFSGGLVREIRNHSGADGLWGSMENAPGKA